MTEARLQKAVHIYSQIQALDEMLDRCEEPEKIKIIFCHDDKHESEMILSKGNKLYKELICMLSCIHNEVRQEFENL